MDSPNWVRVAKVAAFCAFCAVAAWLHPEVSVMAFVAALMLVAASLSE